jgi:thiamine-monophosphate kinase
MKMMTKAAGPLPSRYSKIGDDVVHVRASGKRVVLKVDMLVGKTDIPPGMTYRQAARKSVAMCVSDFAAKGVRPDSYMVSLALPRGITEAEARELAEGFRDASRKWGLKLTGGDTNEGTDLIIDCVLIGFADGVVGRSGARPGDAVVCTGWFGYTSAGFRILMGGAKTERQFGERSVRSVVEPEPNLEAGLRLSKYLTSSIDSSDGLASCLHGLAKESRVGILLEGLPVAEGVAAFGELNGVSLDELALFGGEEYLVVGTLKKASIARARREVEGAGGELLEIGAVRKKHGVFLAKAGGETPVPDAGWRHLS